MRAFIGLALPEGVRQSLGLLQNQLADPSVSVGWVDAVSLHVTLKFLGEITEEQQQAVKQMLQSVASLQGPFSMELEGLGAFPSLRAPKILWVGMTQGCEAVRKLAEAIEKESSKLSFHPEEQRFLAHVTIGRVREGVSRGFLRKLEEVKWQAPSAWQVNSVAFYQSVLTKQGSRYTVLAEAALTGASRP